MPHRLVRADFPLGTEIRLSRGAFICDTSVGEWYFGDADFACLADANDDSKQAVPRMDRYCLSLEVLLYTPSMFIELLAELANQSWFNADKFFAFIQRFREENKDALSEHHTSHEK